ncbi:SDR family NAD(P)-dependent oxidoreductase [Cohnella sp. LGH]|nr:SDR family NAD(P)-dependent oxidoreductase [Cohnella sp. LGH]QTH46561.1 SDR family NAD(P)-dependent oxidoreductase [Cohnella sp. LGH]
MKLHSLDAEVVRKDAINRLGIFCCEERRTCDDFPWRSIIGAGPGLGLSLAKKFGANGFKVALVARNQERLSAMEKELQELHIEARAFAADVNDLAALKQAIQAAKSEFGSIDVLVPN